VAKAATFYKVEEFVIRNEEWITREFGSCRCGVCLSDSGDFRLALRPLEITDVVARKLEELRQMAAKENIQLDFRATIAGNS